jgi:O-antigen ligase
MEDRIQLLPGKSFERGLIVSRALVAGRGASRTEMALAGGTALLLASFLFQAPLAELRLSSSSNGILLHSWDFAGILFGGILLGGLVAHRSKIRAAIVARRSVPGDPIAPVAILAVFACVSLSWVYLTFGSSGLTGAVERVLQLVGVVVLALACRIFMRDRLRTALVVVFIGVAVISAAWAFGAWRWQTSTLTFGAHTLTLHVSRAGGPYGNQFASPRGETLDHWWVPSGASNGLGFILAIAVSVSLVYLLRSFRRGARGIALLMAGAVVILIAGLLATQSRESWLAALAATAAALWPHRRGMGSHRRLGARVLILLGIAAIIVAIPTVRHRITDSFSPGTFAYRTGPQARTDAWKAGVEIGLERFPIGWGVGAIEEHSELFGRSTAENVYLQYFAQLGLVGILSLVAMSLAGLRRGFRAMREAPLRLPTLYALAFFVALVVHGQFGNTLGDPTIQIALALALAFCVPRARRPVATGW